MSQNVNKLLMMGFFKKCSLKKSIFENQRYKLYVCFAKEKKCKCELCTLKKEITFFNILMTFNYSDKILNKIFEIFLFSRSEYFSFNIYKNIFVFHLHKNLEIRNANKILRLLKFPVLIYSWIYGEHYSSVSTNSNKNFKEKFAIF